jgi:hypothetical protein
VIIVGVELVEVVIEAEGEDRERPIGLGDYCETKRK